jgi:hypothetical protein
MPDAPSVSSCELIAFKVCFTGVRDVKVEAYIKDNSGKVVGAYSNAVTHLICPDPTDKSLSKVDKAIKAIESGKSKVIICTLEEFKKLIETKDEEE